MIIRNDDVSVEIDLDSFQKFCNICDKYGYPIIQCITPLGETLKIQSEMTNDIIVSIGKNKMLVDNAPLYEYLKSRNDIIAIHGLWHTHRCSINEIKVAKTILELWGFNPTYFVTPFNEVRDEYFTELEPTGLKLSHKCQRLEDYHKGGIPTDEICYLHSWRYGKWYFLDALDRTLRRINDAGR